MSGYTDMHCHVLPGLDDGPQSLEESLACIDEYLRQGIGEIVVTPHYHPGRYRVSARDVLRGLKVLRTACQETGREVVFYPGQECCYHRDLVKELEAGEVLTMAGTDYVLVEFEPEVLYTEMLRALQELAQAGYFPILAHFERYRCLDRKEDRLMELRGRRVMLQLNYDCLKEPEGLFRHNPWRWYVRRGLVDYVGSDCHGTYFRPLHFEEALAWMRRSVSADIRKRMLRDNIRRLTGGAGRRL